MRDHSDDHDIDRRTLLAGAAMGAGAVGAGVMPASAQAPARQKGPRVWLDMDQKELDDAYDQIRLCPQPRPGAQAQCFQQRSAPAPASGSLNGLAYGPNAVRGRSTCLNSASDRADQCVHPRRRLAPQRPARDYAFPG